MARRSRNPASISARVIDNGPVRKRIKLSMTFEVPAALTQIAARARMSAKGSRWSTATLYAGLDRVDFIAEVNESRARPSSARRAAHADRRN